jgi:SAM-dependent methyltransferase
MILFVDLRGKSCLDLACNDGFWSFRLGRFGIGKVVGVDMSWNYILRANFLKRVYNFTDFVFKRRDILRFLYRDVEDDYDIVLLLSILYHLPKDTDWEKFFGRIYEMNKYCLIIDTRWFDDDEYWYLPDTIDGTIEKWRPTREEAFSFLRKSGYEQLIEIDPSAFLVDKKEAYGNGDPYTVQNVSDYLTEHRTLIIAYKRRSDMPDIQGRLSVKYV